MRELFKIAINLFVISLCAAALLGVINSFTEHERVKNEKQKLEESMQRYLPEEARKAEDVHFYHVYRYFVTQGTEALIGYIVPTASGDTLLLLTPEGALKERKELEKADFENEGARDDAVRAALPAGAGFTYTDAYIFAVQGDKRLASYIKGKTIGFKTWVHMLVALDDANAVKGLEILEHEEDPGLGAEIEQEYYRNQFVGKGPDELASLGVQKTPLPDDYKKALETAKWAKVGLTAEEAAKIRQNYQDEDIYAITGSTISSTRVTNGVKKLVRAFVTRMKIIQNVVREQNISVAF